MATKFKFEIESDGLTPSQTLAFRTFIGTLGGAEFLEQLRQEELKESPAQQDESVETPEPAKIKRASRAKVDEVISETPMQIDARNMDVVEEPQAEEPQAEEPQAEEPQAEEPQAEEAKPKTSAFSIQDVRDRVKEKQGKWRTSIKAELERLGSSSVSLLDPAHFEEFCNFMDNLA